MKHATHFIEVYLWALNNKVFTGPLREIKYKADSLSNTKNADSLETIAVWNIKKKP